MERGLTKAVRCSLLVDSQRQVEDSSKAIRACLFPAAREMDPRRAYSVMKRWYRNVSTRVPNPSRTDMEKVKGGFQTLYQRDDPHPPGLPMATRMHLV